MADTITIRACAAGDVGRLTDHEPPNAGIALAFLRRQDAGDIVYATAWDGDEPRGGAVLDLRVEPAPELKHLFVYPASRGRGIGRALCEWVEDYARAAGHCTILLGVDAGNHAAVSLYESMGYVTTGGVETTDYAYIGADGETLRASETTSTYRKTLTRE